MILPTQQQTQLTMSTTVAKSSNFSDSALSTLESLVLECALETAREKAAAASDSSSLHHSDSSLSYDDLEMDSDAYQELKQLPGNDACADCGCSDDTEWGSVTFGILICTQCSGVHRAMGTHISRVRSVKMDSWSEEQMKRMKFGGNARCNRFLLQLSSDNDSLKDKYNSEAANFYKRDLEDRIKKGQLDNNNDDFNKSMSDLSVRGIQNVSGMMNDSSSRLFGGGWRRRRTPAVAASSPTITYMGRSFPAASVQVSSSSVTSTTRQSTAQTTTPATVAPHRPLVADVQTSSDAPPIKRRLSSGTLVVRLAEELFFREQDVLEITSCPKEFARLKKTLKHNGAITDGVIKQRMFAFVLNRKRRQQEQERQQQQQLAMAPAAVKVEA